MSPNDSIWKNRLYNSYVSSGQVRSAADDSDADAFFDSRGAYLRRMIAQYVPRDRQARILDLGCGHGAILHFLKRAGYCNVAGVDVSAEQIMQAHELGIPEARRGQIITCLDEAPPGSTDVIILFDLLEHLTRTELFSIADRTFRALKKGGACIVHVPNAEGIYGLRARYGDLTHEQAFTPQSLRQLLTTVGFGSVECFEDKPGVHGFRSAIRWLLWELGTMPHRVLLAAETGNIRFILSQNVLAVAKK
jgi:2-polyprenyl-3-methyl-5-hydroxy-6-metoxy-1,4-benzoquinol methylase